MKGKEILDPRPDYLCGSPEFVFVDSDGEGDGGEGVGGVDGGGEPVFSCWAETEGGAGGDGGGAGEDAGRGFGGCGGDLAEDWRRSHCAR
jgi:hypothetical protein